MIFVIVSSDRWLDKTKIHVSFVPQPIYVRRTRRPRHVCYASTRFVIPSTNFHNTPGFVWSTVLVIPFPVWPSDDTCADEDSLQLYLEGTLPWRNANPANEEKDKTKVINYSFISTWHEMFNWTSGDLRKEKILMRTMESLTPTANRLNSARVLWWKLKAIMKCVGNEAEQH